MTEPDTIAALRAIWEGQREGLVAALEVERSRALAAEAQVAVMKAALGCAKEQCGTAVYNITQREHDETVVRSFQSIGDCCGRAIASLETKETDRG